MRSSFKGKKKALLWALLILGALAIVFFVLPQLLLNQWLIPSMKERFRQATGRTLSIDGARLSFGNGATLHLRGVTIEAKKGEAPAAKAKRVQIGFEALPLFQKQINLEEVRLIEPTVRLRRTREGEWNIGDLLPREKRKKGEWQVRLGSAVVALRDGTLFFTDRALPGAPVAWTATGINATLRRPRPNGKIALHATAPAVWRGARRGEAASLQIDGTVGGEGKGAGFPPENAHLTATLTRFDSALIRPYLPSDRIPPFSAEKSRITIAAAGGNLLQPRDLLRSARVRLEGESRGVTVNPSDLPPINIAQADWRYHDRKGGFTLIDTRLLDSHLPRTEGVLLDPLSHPKIHLETFGEVSVSDLARVMAERFGNRRLKKLEAKGRIETALLAKIPLESLPQTTFEGRLALRSGRLTPTASFRPIRQIRGEARLEGKRLVVESLKGEWGGADLSATARMPNLYEEGIEFHLRADTLVWDQIRISKSERDQKKGPPSEPSPAKEKEPSRDPLKERGYAVGLIEIAHLVVKDYDFYAVESALIYQDRVLRLRETEAFFEDGIAKADFAQVYFRPDGSYALALTPRLSEIKIFEFLRDFGGGAESPVMSGKALVAGGLNTEGKNYQEFKQNLRGALAVYLDNGTIYRFETLARIFSLMNLFTLPELNVEGIEYDAISGTLDIKGGEVSLNNAILYGEDVRIIADGEILLPERRFDLTMGVQVFRVVDKVLEKIPLAGPILLGEDRMFIAAYFDVEGAFIHPYVDFRPLKTIREPTLGVLRRALTFPARPELFG